LYDTENEGGGGGEAAAAEGNTSDVTVHSSADKAT
jgi:hypothetical protein